ncbi:hypothetical protein C7999DRAFT_16117 [Corynascus novoguineensis]|uniref:Uncharacterized protein n=1 Tax=Corynascus novoguineensis TaxID=1126955 RepID=A0AAN7HDC6_9PEZI|nr:hypothetical protein C7999DRAFT_16117 [Corynascus novoguineensis]
MDQDQFGGRTDDDLFSDDIEPVEEETIIMSEPVVAQNTPAQPEPAPAPPAPQAPAAQQSAPTAPARPAKGSLAQSRHAPSPRRDNKSPRPPSNNNNNNDSRPPRSSGADDSPSTQETTPTSPNTSSKQPPTGPREPSSSSNTPPTTTTPAKTTPGPASNNGSNNNNNINNNNDNNNNNNTASAVSQARLNSGANPRTKLTEAELSERMERMRLLAAEKTRRFEEAQRDESEHAVALARGMEEARRRRAEEAARRRAAEEERRRLEDERARNRERKLRAMAAKEGGGWDAGKEELAGREDERRGGFKGAHGGVRGARSGAGLGGSRFAGGSGGSPADEGGDFDGFGLRGRGGRGRGGRGRGGRGGAGQALFDEREGENGRDHGRQNAPAAAPSPPEKANLKKEDFPPLPTSGAAPKNADAAWVSKPGDKLPLASPVGKWDEEVAADIDARQNSS